MIYLSGAITPTMLAHPRPDLGIMLQPGGNRGVEKAFPFWPWAADNGCFALGETFQPGAWLEWLASLRSHRQTCLFAVAPDVPYDAAATVERSRPYLPTIRQLGFPAAYVTQNGQEKFDPPWGEFEVLFIGGDDDWKLSECSYALASEAKARGLWVHMGRVNSLRRMVACHLSRIDSADGTFVKWGPDRRLPEVYDWLDQVNHSGQTDFAQEVLSHG